VARTAHTIRVKVRVGGLHSTTPEPLAVFDSRTGSHWLWLSLSLRHTSSHLLSSLTLFGSHSSWHSRSHLHSGTLILTLTLARLFSIRDSHSRSDSHSDTLTHSRSRNSYTGLWMYLTSLIYQYMTEYAILMRMSQNLLPKQLYQQRCCYACRDHNLKKRQCVSTM
jgi:hypothetical protein